MVNSWSDYRWPPRFYERKSRCIEQKQAKNLPCRSCRSRTLYPAELRSLIYEKRRYSVFQSCKESISNSGQFVVWLPLTTAFLRAQITLYRTKTSLKPAMSQLSEASALSSRATDAGLWITVKQSQGPECLYSIPNPGAKCKCFLEKSRVIF